MHHTRHTGDCRRRYTGELVRNPFHSTLARTPKLFGP